MTFLLIQMGFNEPTVAAWHSSIALKAATSTAHSSSGEVSSWKFCGQTGHVWAYGLKTEPAFCSFFLKSSYDIVGWGGVITYMLRCCKFSCTFINTSCYAAASSLALPYIPTCYAAASSLVLSYICHATLLQVLLHFPTYVMLRCCKFSCTSIHTDMLRKQKESSTCEEQRVKNKEWRKNEGKKWRPLWFWQKLGKNGRPKFLEKTLTPSHETVKKWWFLWDERKGQKHALLKCGFDKQPAGMFDSKKIGICPICPPFLRLVWPPDLRQTHWRTKKSTCGFNHFNQQKEWKLTI